MVLNPNTTIFAAAINTATVFIFFLVAVQLLRFWKREKDPLSGALSATILLLAVGYLFEVVSEYVTISSGVTEVGNLLTYFFFVFFILSYPPLAYFYVGLFSPRNRWFVPLISFAGGFSLNLILSQEVSYGVPFSALIPFALLTFGLYLPLAVSCLRTAPKAPKKITQMKFKLVGRFAFLWMITFVLFGVTGGIQGLDVVISNIIFFVVGVLMMLTVLHAWFGWAMPEFLRKRYNQEETGAD